jgi:hypothetical protein
MERISRAGDALLDAAFDKVEALGAPIAILAWLAVLLAALGMAAVLRRHPDRERSRSELWVGAFALAAHMADYAVTLRASPDLALEANPIWRVVLDTLGLRVALLYGFTGKLLLSLLCFQCFAWYRATRADLYPAGAANLVSFVRGLGGANLSRVHLPNLVNFFCFAFPLQSLFVAYVTLLNTLVDDPLYLRLPSMPVALVAWLALVAIAYPLATWRAYCRTGSHLPRGPDPAGPAPAPSAFL